MATDKHLKAESDKHLKRETDVYLKPEMIKKEYGIGRQLLIYTLLFAVAALGAYSFYIIGNSVFITGEKGGNKDGLAQIIPSYLAVKHIIQNVLAGGEFSGWNWSIGLGGDNWNMFAPKLANPFTYMIIAFPDEKIDLGYTLVSVFRQYCVGVAFLFFGRKVSLTWVQNILGALCYAFSMWMFMTIQDQAGFNTAALLFPILMLGAEKIIDHESPLIFIIAVFYFLTAGVVWGYASGIMVIIYFFLRMIMKGSLKEPKEFFGTTGRFFICGIAGVLIAAFFVSEILMSMSGATTDTGSGKHAWFTLSKYLAAPVSLYKAVGTGANSYSAIGLPIVGVVLMPMIVRKAFKGKCEAVIALLLLIGSQIPAVCRMFNGFSYPSGRWFYMIAFFVTWAAIENFSNETFRSIINCILMELWIILTAGWVIFRYAYLEMDNRKTAITGAAGLVFGTMIVVLGRISAVMANSEKLTRTRLVISRAAVILIVLITVADIVEIGVFDTFTHARDGVPGHMYVGESYPAIMNTCETVMTDVQQEDTDFYRYSRMGGYYGVRSSGTMVNTSIALGTRPIYMGFSSAPSAWHEFNKTVGNCAGSYRRTLIGGNDNRAMLDYLMGVKYFLGSLADKSIAENRKASLFVPYGYEESEEKGGYDLFRNKHCMGLGTSFSQYITESELMEYPLQVREQVLMQAAVVPDDYVTELDGVKHASKDDIATDLNKAGIKITAADGISIDTEKKQIEVKNPEGYIEIKTDDITNSQVLLSLQNFERKAMTYEEYTKFMTGGSLPDEDYLLFKEKVMNASFRDKLGFNIHAKVKVAAEYGEFTVTRGTKSERGGIRSFNDLVDFDINLGYYESFPGVVKVCINNPGIYTYDEIAVCTIPMENYDRNAEMLDSRRFEISDWGDDFVEGTMTCAEDSIMYFSILRNKGWKIYVDGEEAEKINDVDISFTGALLPAGEHKVELRYFYPYFYPLVALTVTGLLLTVALMIRYNKEKRNRRGQGN